MGLLPLVLAAAVVTGPITGGDHGQPFSAMPAADLTQAAYTEAEFFISGTATAYKPAGPLTIDGAWKVAPDTTADYKVRMLVRRPADPKRFNGIVVVEWLNVTANLEGAADFMQMQEELLRQGYAWIGVGAQAAGVNSPRSGLKDWDKARYGSLVHPGDAYSYDIFSQTADALRHPKGPNALAGLTIGKMMATGRSQSAFRLVTYINAVHPLVHLFDGYLVHSRGANASGFKAEGLARDADNAVPPGAHIRADIDVPVLDLQTEGDMVALRVLLTHQPAFAR
jgi:Alpha/beta hydrolase domain